MACIAGGGGGAARTATAGGSGGGGEYRASTLTVVPGTIYNLQVGAGGTGGAAGGANAGTNGTASWFNTSSIINANPGTGAAGLGSGAAGSGGTGTTGHNGGAGGARGVSSSVGGGGGGGGSASGAGVAGVAGDSGGAGSVTGGGNGGNGANASNGTANTGGGGGGAALGFAGGNGGSGLVTVTYTLASTTHTGVCAGAAQSSVVAGAGTTGRVGTDADTAQSALVSGAGKTGRKGTATDTAQSSLLTGSGKSGRVGSGSPTAQHSLLSGLGKSGRIGAGAAIAHAASITAIGLTGHAGIGAFAARSAIVFHTEEIPKCPTPPLPDSAWTKLSAFMPLAGPKLPGYEERLAFVRANRDIARATGGDEDPPGNDPLKSGVVTGLVDNGDGTFTLTDDGADFTNPLKCGELVGWNTAQIQIFFRDDPRWIVKCSISASPTSTTLTLPRNDYTARLAIELSDLIGSYYKCYAGGDISSYDQWPNGPNSIEYVGNPTLAAEPTYLPGSTCIFPTVQIGFTGAPAGTYTLSITTTSGGTSSTAPITFGASATAIQTAITTATSVGASNAAVLAYNGGFAVAFDPSLGATASVSVGTSSLTGGAVVISALSNIALDPTQNFPVNRWITAWPTAPDAPTAFDIMIHDDQANGDGFVHRLQPVSNTATTVTLANMGDFAARPSLYCYYSIVKRGGLWHPKAQSFARNQWYSGIYDGTYGETNFPDDTIGTFPQPALQVPLDTGVGTLLNPCADPKPLVGAFDVPVHNDCEGEDCCDPCDEYLAPDFYKSDRGLELSIMAKCTAPWVDPRWGVINTTPSDPPPVMTFDVAIDAAQELVGSDITSGGFYNAWEKSFRLMTKKITWIPSLDADGNVVSVPTLSGGFSPVPSVNIEVANQAKTGSVGVSLHPIGTLLVAFVAFNGTTDPGGSAVTDNRGNSWTYLGCTSTGGASLIVAAYWTASPSLSDTTVKFSPPSGGKNSTLVVYDVIGADTGSPIDDSQNAVGTSTTPAAPSLTTTAANDLLLCFGAFNTSDANWTVGSGWNMDASVSDSTIGGFAAEHQPAVTSGSYATGFTISASQYNACFAVAIKRGTLGAYLGQWRKRTASTNYVLYDSATASIQEDGEAFVDADLARFLGDQPHFPTLPGFRVGGDNPTAQYFDYAYVGTNGANPTNPLFISKTLNPTDGKYYTTGVDAQGTGTPLVVGTVQSFANTGGVTTQITRALTAATNWNQFWYNSSADVSTTISGTATSDSATQLIDSGATFGPEFWGLTAVVTHSGVSTAFAINGAGLTAHTLNLVADSGGATVHSGDAYQILKPGGTLYIDGGTVTTGGSTSMIDSTHAADPRFAPGIYDLGFTLRILHPVGDGSQTLTKYMITGVTQSTGTLALQGVDGKTIAAGDGWQIWWPKYELSRFMGLYCTFTFADKTTKEVRIVADDANTLFVDSAGGLVITSDNAAAGVTFAITSYLPGSTLKWDNAHQRWIAPVGTDPRADPTTGNHPQFKKDPKANQPQRVEGAGPIHIGTYSDVRIWNQMYDILRMFTAQGGTFGWTSEAVSGISEDNGFGAPTEDNDNFDPSDPLRLYSIEEQPVGYRSDAGQADNITQIEAAIGDFTLQHRGPTADGVVPFQIAGYQASADYSDGTGIPHATFPDGTSLQIGSEYEYGVFTEGDNCIMPSTAEFWVYTSINAADVAPGRTQVDSGSPVFTTIDIFAYNPFDTNFQYHLYVLASSAGVSVGRVVSGQIGTNDPPSSYPTLELTAYYGPPSEHTSVTAQVGWYALKNADILRGFIYPHI